MGGGNKSVWKNTDVEGHSGSRERRSKYDSLKPFG
jgi:hypothetical protein